MTFLRLAFLRAFAKSPFTTPLEGGAGGGGGMVGGGGGGGGGGAVMGWSVGVRDGGLMGEVKDWV